MYYHCSLSRDHSCKEPYLEERDLIKYLNHFIDEMEEKDLHIPEKLQGALMEYQKLVKDTLFFKTNTSDDDSDVGIKDYAKYILREGTNKAKRELVLQLPVPKFLHERSLCKKESENVNKD